MNRFLRVTCISSFLVTVTGCGTEQYESPIHSFNVHQEGSLSVSVNSGGPKYQEELFTYNYLYSLQEDDREESILTMPSPSGPILDEDRNTYLVDGRGSYVRIVVFNQEGVYQHDIGRVGSGPGEFRFPTIVDVENGVLTVLARQLNRLIRFRTDGSLIEQKLVHEAPMSVTDSAQWLEGDRTLSISRLRFMPSEVNTFRQIQVTVTSSTGDTLWSYLSDKIVEGKMLPRRRGNVMGYSPLPKPFNPLPRALYSRGKGVMVTTGEEATIEYLDIDGGVYHRVEIDLPYLPVNSEDERQYEDDYRTRNLESGSMETSEIETRIRQIEYPENKAFWTHMLVDEIGYIWLQIPDYWEGSGNAEEGLTYRVINPEGEYLGITKFPPGQGIISHGHLLQTQIDPDTDELKILVFNIRSTVRGLKFPN